MKKLLIVVDYQKDFVTGSLGFDGAKNIENAIADKIMSYKNNGDYVVATMDTHTENYLETQEGKNLPVKHCIKGTEGHGFYGKINDYKDKFDKIILKPSFGSGELFEWLKGNDFDSIELCGVVTNICVISNAVMAKTACPEAEIFVDKSAVASNDKALESYAFTIMENLQIKII